VTLCVYALTRGTSRVSATGIRGERMRVVREGPLGAVVGALPSVPRGSVGNLRRYDRTLGVLAATLPALLPARFGTCFDEIDELRFVLRSRRPALQRALQHVRGRAQMTIRMVVAPAAAAVEPEDGRRQRPEDASRPGTAFLRSRAEAAARARHVEGFDPVRAAVRRWVRDERVERRAGVTTVYHLVPRGSADTYHRALEGAAARAGLRMRVTGPWPPYAFTEGW